MKDLQKRASAILATWDPEDRKPSQAGRPFMIELFGTPKSGKSTIKEALKHFFRRNGWRVSAPTEGAEVVEWPRDEPVYNFQTCEYALSAARDRSYSDFHIVLFDRAIYDGVMRMEYYAEKGVITREQQRIIEGYYLLPWNRHMFDLHICLVASPEVSIAREVARKLTVKHGQTMNPKTLQGLLDAHERLWERLRAEDDPKMVWHDSTQENEKQTATKLLAATLEACARRLAG